jgi:hypothetical protein
MGQENSSPVDEDVSPEILDRRTLDGVASYIKNGKAKKVVVLVSLSYYHFLAFYLIKHLFLYSGILGCKRFVKICLTER